MYVVGAPVHLTVQFTDSTNTPVDPGAVVCTIIDPTATTTTPTAVRDSTGVYHYDYTPALAGQFTWFFVGSGANASIQLPDVFTVHSATTGALISLRDAKEALNMSLTSHTNDAELWRMIHAATGIINAECGYTAPTTFTEWVDGRADFSGRASIVLRRTPVLSVTSIVPQASGMPGPDLTALVGVPSDSGVIQLGNYLGFYGPMLVTYVAGRSSVPAALQSACALIVDDMWKSQRGGSTTTPMMGTDGGESAADNGLPFRALQLMRLAGFDRAPGIA